MTVRAALFAAMAAGLVSPLAAQPEEAEEHQEDRVVIDILVEQPSDPVIIERCDREADEAKIAGEIVVCRERREQGPVPFDRQDWERRYAEATQGVKTPDVDGSGLRAPSGAPMMPIVTIAFGGPPEQPLIIDVEALPEAPAGSDADRIARGLEPLADDDGLSAEEIALRNRALGLPPTTADGASE